MPRYVYTFLNNEEKTKKSFIEASSLKEAKEYLYRQGLMVLSVKEKRSWFKQSPKAQDVITFSQQLALLLKSGLPLYESLISLEDRYQGQPLGRVVTTFARRIREGAPLSEAMEEFPEVFDDFYRGNIVAGEVAGGLDEVLTRLVMVLERRAKFKGSIVSALAYPLTLMIFSFGVIIFFLLGVVPSLKEVLENTEKNTLTSCVFGFSDFCCKYKGLLGMGGLSLVGVFLWLRRRVSFAVYVERIVMRIPFLRKVCVKSLLGEFFLLVSSVLKGGSSLIKGLEVGRQAIAFRCIREDIKEVTEAIVSGGTLSTALQSKGWVPKLVIQMTALGEETGELPELLACLGNMYVDDTQKTLNMLATWCQPVILVCLGGVIGFIMLAILLPLTSNVNI
ncbi:type II secretion system F family protein [Chlamydiifrater phoenicopteri]|uniref:type II secretion system F family protein n=1 Tax=Chlamydiifrater phoenicopteri TaxID=2681469 RepID=UPI001BCE6367|nr:type II secretion system F family protein [Chlamydiifrater phoenicopteri]